jgi:hypothetical protein
MRDDILITMQQQYRLVDALQFTAEIAFEKDLQARFQRSLFRLISFGQAPSQLRQRPGCIRPPR